jgi:hypothetical protein
MATRKRNTMSPHPLVTLTPVDFATAPGPAWLLERFKEAAQSAQEACALARQAQAQRAEARAQLAEAVALARQAADAGLQQKQRADVAEDELAEALRSLETPTLDDLRNIFEAGAARLFPWELREFTALVTETAARLDPHGEAGGVAR